MSWHKNLMNLVVLHVDLFLFGKFGGPANCKLLSGHEFLLLELTSPIGIACGVQFA